MFTRRLAPLTFALIAVVAACAAPGAAAPATDQQSAAPSSATPSASRPAAPPIETVPAGELLFEGSLLICSDLPYPPQEFFDAQGNPIGSDIEIGQEIARRLGLQARIVNSMFDTIIDAVLGGKCDIVISAQNITAEREARVTMIPYFKAGQTFLVQQDNPAAIHTELDLCAKRIAAQSGTVEVDFVQGTGDYRDLGLSRMCRQVKKGKIELHEFDKDDEALEALINGDVDAYFVDSPAAGYHVIQRSAELDLSGLTLDIAPQGISVPPDKTGLERAVRSALDAMISDGTYVGILARYGVEDGSVAQDIDR